MRIRESDQLKNVLAQYEQDSEQKNTHSSYERLNTILKKSFGQKMRARNFEDRSERTVTAKKGNKKNASESKREMHKRERL